MAEDLKQLARRFYDAVNAGDVDGAMSLVAEDFVDHEEFPGLSDDRDGVRQFFELMRSAFPDFHIDVDDMLAEGDKVAVRMRMSGTHQGDFMGIPPTGKRVTMQGIDIVRLEGGKLAEHWAIFDELGMMQQLGVIPAPGQSG